MGASFAWDAVGRLNTAGSATDVYSSSSTEDSEQSRGGAGDEDTTSDSDVEAGLDPETQRLLAASGSGSGSGLATAVAGSFVLRDVSLNVRQGELVCVMGSVGAGKSSLLAACACGDMERLCGEVHLTGRVAYVEQRPWIQGGTLR